MNEYKATLKYYGENKPAKLIVHPDSLLLPVDVEFVVTIAGGGRLELERPRGEWKKKPENYDYFYCSKCGYAYKHAFNFCPNCGADMRKGATSHD